MSPIYLALDTSGTRTALALVKDDKPIFETSATAPYGHNEKLLDLLKEALDQTGITLNQITAICLTIGPGMFTSLRVGLSVAKGLALTGKLPLKGVNTLYALAATAEEHSQPVLALIDARRGELYTGLYYQGTPIIKPSVLPPEQLPTIITQSRLPATVVRVAGDGTRLALPFLNNMHLAVETTDIIYPAPVTIARIGAKLLAFEGADEIDHLEPIYLRRTDAELKRQQLS
ncbi:MAG: tRNA (adenosine(37)-N6)-threonylcarbamoyltransferase complex dimerization subunit type 1 TsaB [candidate division WOR-3 bacterium]|jgi:tRNA threonylcarbamoyladenosine biosynthesis protein TsaB|nr:tRNA (adenosine(37)-N6)-threonylcarbamoyltransferase complex dimerization subunit type 1 TsaB [candidate division WOR-3 bacterium]MCR4423475.1 tRNA (adenosine(37)-N6)-threonylcarbamoyltransferase complex dimerization subunit type 1 TsaB [candidate division WOR-3 bacterium]MDH7518814.1 tRNA (adenosine(37)-N6)-threonylcarbamoyltransferase complex dimerization subunit type 1 TsaB [bacterium]